MGGGGGGGGGGIKTIRLYYVNGLFTLLCGNLFLKGEGKGQKLISQCFQTSNMLEAIIIIMPLN